MKVTHNGMTLFTGKPVAFAAVKSEMLQELGVNEADLEITLSPDEMRNAVRA
jgi:hypothetical protein